MATFAQLKTDIAKWLNREGMTAVTDMVEDFLALAERRTYRDMDIRALETEVSTTTASLSLPSDFLRMKNMWVEYSGSPVIVRGTSYQNVLKQQQKTSGVPCFYTLSGDNIVLGPTPNSAYTLNYVYYTNLTPLSDANTTNWFTLNVPELFLFGALMEAALYLKDDNRAQLWAARYKDIKASLEKQEERSDMESGSLQVQMN